MAIHTIRNTCACSACVAIPLRRNHYRPYALRHPVLAAISAFLIAAKGTSLLFSILTPQTAYLATISAPYLVDRTNQARAEAGLPALASNPLLQESARLKGEDMLNNNYFAHNSPQGVTPWKWFDDVGYTYVYAGENLAIDFQTGEGAFTAWMDSPGHRKNILSENYREIGIAVVTGEFDGRTTTVIVQHFGSLVAGPVAQQTPTPTETPTPAETPTPTPTPTPQPTSTPQPATPEPIPAPTIIEPEEGTLLPSGAATVRGTAPPNSDVHVSMNEQPLGTWPTVDGAFHGTFVPPEDTEMDATLLAQAEIDGRTGPSSAPRRITIDTRSPTIAKDEAFFLPDPTGDITALLLVVPISDSIKEVTADIGRIRIPMTIKGNVASATVSKQALGHEFQVYIEDQNGNIGMAALQPLRVFHDAQRTESEQATQKRITIFMSQFQIVTFWILSVIILLFSATIMFRLRAENIDIAAHAAFVIALGATLLLLT